MNIQNQINNIITYSLFIGLSLGLIFVYFAQERLYREMTVGDISLGPERFLRNVSVVFIFSNLRGPGRPFAASFTAFFFCLFQRGHQIIKPVMNKSKGHKPPINASICVVKPPKVP